MSIVDDADRFGTWVVRLHGAFIGAFGTLTFTIELGTHFFGWAVGPFAFMHDDALARMLGSEAHGLAVVLGATWIALSAGGPPDRRLHVTGLAAAVLLGSMNLLYWAPAFGSTGFTAGGVVSTAGHVGFAVAQAVALAWRGTVRAP
jgi:hypothetical protein